MPSQGKGQWKKRPNQQEGGSGSAANKKRKYFAAGNTAGLPLGSRGFLISCLGGKEQQSAFEASRLLQEFFDAAQPKKEEDKPEAAAGADMEALLAAEVQDLKSNQSRLFNYVKTNVNGLLYLQMQRDVEGPGPTELVLALAKEVERTRQCKSRLCVRFTPVEYVAQGSVSAMKALAKDIMPKSFPLDADAKATKFALQYEHRASVKLDRKQVIDAFVDEIPCPPYKVDLERPDSTILVQVVRNSAAVAVVPEYWQLRKFNIRELCMSDEERAAQEAASAAARGKQAAAKPSADATVGSSGAHADAEATADAGPDAADVPPADGEQPTAAAAGVQAPDGVDVADAEEHRPPEEAPATDAADAPAHKATSEAGIASASVQDDE